MIIVIIVMCQQLISASYFSKLVVGRFWELFVSIVVHEHRSVQSNFVIEIWKKLFAGGPPANKKLFTEGPPAN